MNSIRDIKARAKGVGETLKITRAMKLISTSKLRKARSLLDASHPYFERIRSFMALSVVHSEAFDSPYFNLRQGKDNRRKAAIVITSDKGLTGGYNVNVLRYAESTLDPKTFFVVVGQVGKRFYLGKNLPILEDFRIKGKLPSVSDASEIADYVIDQFRSGIIDEIVVVYTRMHSSVRLVPETIQLLPFDRGDIIAHAQDKDHSLYSFAPDPEAVFEALVPRYLSGVIYGTLVESYASEQSARMQAMDAASKNAEEMIARMNLQFNRARQQIITQEVSEIVAGAAALNG